MIRRTVICFAVLFGCLLTAACQQDVDRTRLRAFEAESKKAQKAFLDQEDYAAAEQHYHSALQIAEDMQWTDGIVMTRRALSEVATAKKRYSDAEMILQDALRICKAEQDCSSPQLASLYDRLMFLYLFWIKDGSKARDLAEDVIRSRERLSATEDVNARLIDYADRMKIAGFEKEADSLLRRLQQ